jgi:hypothetical protein
MAEKPLELWQLDDWNRTLFHHYFAERGDRTKVTRLAVTSEELSKAVDGVAGPDEARASLVGVLRKSLRLRSLGSDAQRRAAPWDSSADLLPPFVVHLLFTCMVVGDAAEHAGIRWRLPQALESPSGLGNGTRFGPAASSLAVVD